MQFEFKQYIDRLLIRRSFEEVAFEVPKLASINCKQIRKHRGMEETMS